MRAVLTPGKLCGEVRVPSSKSMAHRYLIAACLCGGCTVRNVSFSEDIYATMRCLSALGMQCIANEQEGTIIVKKGESPTGEALFDCGESGSTLRFFMPIALQLCPQGAKFIGKGRLLARPQQPYYEMFEQKGVKYIANAKEITVKGTLPAGEYRLSGGISSQFVTGLLFALSLCEEGVSKVIITDELQSKAYVDMTVASMKAFGVAVENRDHKEFIIPGGQRYRASEVAVEADYSQAAFFLTAAYFGQDIRVCGLDENSLQGDKAILTVLEKLKRPGDVTVDVSEIPDLAPILAVAASVREGKTDIVGGVRLRFKESDRIETTVCELKKLGANITERPDGMEIIGKPMLSQEGTVFCDSHNDHRIAMAAAIAATVCGKETTVIIEGAEAVNKSYPTFWEVYRSLGGNVRLEEAAWQ